MYVQNKGNVLLLSMGSIQRNLHRLFCEALLGHAEEMHFHLIVENWGGGERDSEPRGRHTVLCLSYDCLQSVYY